MADRAENRRWNGGSVALWVVAAFSCLLFLNRAAAVVRDQLWLPFDVSVEIPNAIAIHAIRAGENVYDEKRYAAPPFHILGYTPGYDYLAAVLPQKEGNPFFTGRLVSAAFMLLAAACFFPAGGGVSRPGPWLVFPIFFLARSVLANAVSVKNDSTALFFSMAAVVLAVGDRGPVGWRTVLSALSGFAAFLCKQSFLAAVVSILVYHAGTDRRKAVVFSLTVFSAAVVAGVFAHTFWGRGFWFSVFRSFQNPFAWSQITSNLAEMGSDPYSLFLAVLCSWSCAGALRGGRSWVLASPYRLYLLFSVVVLAMTLGKKGSSLNYFFELLGAAGLLSVHELSNRSPGFHPAGWAALAVAACGFGEAGKPPGGGRAFLDAASVARAGALRAEIREEMGALGAGGSRVLNLVGAPVSSYFDAAPDVSDMYHYVLLWKGGALELDPLLSSVRGALYDVIIVPLSVTADTELPPGPLQRLQEEVFRSYRPVREGMAFRYMVRSRDAGG